MRVLLIGDPHVTVEELDDCKRLLDLVDKVALAELPDIICFMGDQHHTHAVVRVEVLEFWTKWLCERKCQRDVFMLVGNHDRSNDLGVEGHTLRYGNLYDDHGATIVATPEDWGPVRFMPWYPTAEEFVKAAGDRKALICHQTMQGSHYENGYPAKDGVAAELVPAKTIISGHLHTPQAFGKVWYPGAPRWRTASDANIDRALWLVDIDDTGAIVSKRPFPTNGVCRALYTFEDREGLGDDTDTPEIAWMQQPLKLTVNIFGSPVYVEDRTKHWKNLFPGCRVNPFPTREAKHAGVRESDGVQVALKRYVEAYQPRFGTPLDQLQKLVGERVRL